MNIFVSMPMNGKTDEEIIAKMQEVEKKFNKDNVGYVVCGYTDTTDMVNVPHIFVNCLSEAIKRMSYCDVVYFVDGWQTARGCQIEHDICMEYDIPMMFEDDDDDDE